MQHALFRLIALLAAASLLVAPALAQDEASLRQQVAQRLRAAGQGIRFGIVVTDEGGRELIAIDPDGRYIPASNTKMFTTAAAFWTLSDLDRPDPTGGTAVRLDATDRGPADVVIEGHGDARLSSAADCTVDCLATLADAVAAKTRVVHDVVGDDSRYPDERWSQGMSWNNIPTRSGTATSALTLDDNEMVATVTPGTAGTTPVVAMAAYFTLDNRLTTLAAGARGVSVDRAPNLRRVRLTGSVAAGSKPERLRMGIDDPADYAAWVFAGMLRARGVRVTGTSTARHRPLDASDDPALRRGTPPVRPPSPAPLAMVTPAPLIEDLTTINKVSQNLHAELMLRRVGLVAGTGSVADGLLRVRAMLAAAGVPRADYDFSDGSGMSTYNRVAPRGVAIFLRWVAAQPWGAAWRATLPVGGEAMLKRFAGSPLDHKVFAKTGTLNATTALSGYMVARSGATLTFATYANDVPEGADAAGAVTDVLKLIAAAS